MFFLVSVQRKKNFTVILYYLIVANDFLTETRSNNEARVRDCSENEDRDGSTNG